MTGSDDIGRNYVGRAERTNHGTDDSDVRTVGRGRAPDASFGSLRWETGLIYSVGSEGVEERRKTPNPRSLSAKDETAYEVVMLCASTVNM